MSNEYSKRVTALLYYGVLDVNGYICSGGSVAQNAAPYKRRARSRARISASAPNGQINGTWYMTKI